MVYSRFLTLGFTIAAAAGTGLIWTMAQGLPGAVPAADDAHLLAGSSAPAAVTVRDEQGFRDAVSRARPGTRILVAPGEYPGGFYFSGIRGEKGKPIVIAALDPKDPPRFKGGSAGVHLSDPSHVELLNLVFTGARQNGVNIDDGGSFDTPAHHIVIRGLRVTDVGPQGNRDGLKLSGVDDFRVEGCHFENWGVGGSGIDMVGCHRGVVEGCLFRHTDISHSNGVQAKGGSREIVVRRNRFENAGERGVNMGGSTGLGFFRPPLKTGTAREPGNFEAKDIRVEGNTFIGGRAAVAFIGVDGAVARFNTIYRPKRWAVRILQENQNPSFVPSRNGRFTDNLVAFRSDELAVAVNVGPHTAPETFTFSRNLWYCLDRPERSRPQLPVEEEAGVYGKDPRFRDAERGDLRLRPGSPGEKMGAEALPR